MGVAYITEHKNCLNYKNTKVSKENVDRIKAHGDRTELEKSSMKNYRPKSEKTASFAWKSAELNRETAPLNSSERNR